MPPSVVLFLFVRYYSLVSSYTFRQPGGGRERRPGRKGNVGRGRDGTQAGGGTGRRPAAGWGCPPPACPAAGRPAGQLVQFEAGSGERCVGCGLDVAVDLWGIWAFEHALGEHDDGQILRWVNQPGGAQSAVPAEPAAVVDRLAEPPRPAVEEPWQKPAAGLLRRGQLVGGHGPHRVGWQDRRPAAQQHPGEGEQVVGGGY